MGARPSDLVEDQQSRRGHQRATDGQHLLLAARQGAGQLCNTLTQNREQGEHLVHLARRVASGARRIRAHFEVLADGQTREQSPPFLAVRDAEFDALVRGKSADVLAGEQDPAALGRSRPLTTPASVVFPAPLAPNTATTSPQRIDNSTSLSALAPP